MIDILPFIAIIILAVCAYFMYVINYNLSIVIEQQNQIRNLVDKVRYACENILMVEEKIMLSNKCKKDKVEQS